MTTPRHRRRLIRPRRQLQDVSLESGDVGVANVTCPVDGHHVEIEVSAILRIQSFPELACVRAEVAARQRGVGNQQCGVTVEAGESRPP